VNPAFDPDQNRSQPPAEAPRGVRIRLPAARPTVTVVLIVFTSAIFLLQQLSVRLLGYADPQYQVDYLELFGGRINDLIRMGQLWRFLTPALLHVSFPHILLNMYSLWVVGSGLERFFGHRRFLVLYGLGAFSGNVLSFLRSSGFSVGASTAIFGLVGAELIFLLQNRQLYGQRFGGVISNVLIVIAANLGFGFIPGTNIDYWGHIGGLLGGLIFCFFSGPRFELVTTASSSAMLDQRGARQDITGAAVVVLLFGALAVYGLIR
jgi:rhomboid protease GluP